MMLVCWRMPTIIPNLIYMILVVVSNCVKLKICLKHVFSEKSIKRFGTLKWSQEGENSVRYSQTIDLPYTKRRRFPDQPYGLGNFWSAGKLQTFQALFSRPTEFGPYIGQKPRKCIRRLGKHVIKTMSHHWDIM